MSAQHAAASATAEIPAVGTGPTQLLPPVADLRAAAAGHPLIAPGLVDPWGSAARPDWSAILLAPRLTGGPGRALPSLAGWWGGRRSARHPVRHHAARRVMVRHRAGRVEPITRPIPIPCCRAAPRHRRGGTVRAVLVSLRRLLIVPVVLVPLAATWAVGLQLCIEAVAVWP